MDDELLEETIDEIDRMTPEEYWILYWEAQRICAFPAFATIDWL
jgi:hypothetical protein